MRRADDPDIIGARPPLAFGLFAEAVASAGLSEDEGARTVSRQREAAPDVAVPEPRPVPRAAMPGAGQAARQEARVRARRTQVAAYRTIALSLEGHGPQTRRELAETTGMPVNTINARVAEMRDLARDDWRVITNGRRNGESIVHLAKLEAVPTPTED